MADGMLADAATASKLDSGLCRKYRNKTCAYQVKKRKTSIEMHRVVCDVLLAASVLLHHLLEIPL